MQHFSISWLNFTMMTCPNFHASLYFLMNELQSGIRIQRTNESVWIRNSMFKSSGSCSRNGGTSHTCQLTVQWVLGYPIPNTLGSDFGNLLGSSDDRLRWIFPSRNDKRQANLDFIDKVQMQVAIKQPILITVLSCFNWFTITLGAHNLCIFENTNNKNYKIAVSRIRHRKNCHRERI